MKIGRFLLGCAALFWGWQSGYWIAGLLLAPALESPWSIRQRWELGPRELDRITDFTTLALIASLIFLGVRNRSLSDLRPLLVWLPVFFLPLVLAQGYSVRQRMPLSSLFLSLRRLQRKGVGKAYEDIDVRAPYLGLLLVSAGAMPAARPFFWPAALALIAWLLWLNRSPRFRAALCAGLILVAGGLSLAGNLGVQAVSRALQGMFVSWYRDYRRSLHDPYHTYTAIGDVGKLKQSGQILFRVRTRDTSGEGLLLEDAVYDIYNRGFWYADRAKLTQVRPSPDNETRWPLTAQGPGPRGTWIEISEELNPKGEGLILHALGTYLIDRLPVPELWRNGLGTLKVKDGPPLVTFRLYRDPNIVTQAPPGRSDLDVPPGDRPVMAQILEQLGTRNLTPVGKIVRIEEFFRDNFGYSLTLARPPPGVSPLEQFLLHSRAGHCEYFATATVLLLRQAGIPARYVTGYSVREYSYLEGAYRVRGRHAHAWALAFVEGHWRIIDTTPSVWAQRDSSRDSVLRPLADLASWARHAFLYWRWHQEDPGSTRIPVYAWLLVPLVTWLAWRLLRGKRAKVRRTPDTDVRGLLFPGADSAFFAVARRVEQTGWPRDVGEPLHRWIARISLSPHFPWSPDELLSLARLHNRYRYSPGGLNAEERAELHRQVSGWLARHGV